MRRTTVAGPARVDAARWQAVTTARPLRWHGLVRDRPVTFAVTALAATLVVQLGLGRLVGAGLLTVLPDNRYADLLARGGSLTTAAVGSVFVTWLLVRLGWWRAVGFTSPRRWRRLHLLWLPALLLALLVTAGHRRFDLGDPLRLLIAVPEQGLVGYLEEALTRGLVLFTLLVAWQHRPSGVRNAVVVSSLLFGLAHLPAAVFGAPPVPVLGQVVYATFLGVMFAGLVLRTNSLWLPVVVHALVNTVTVALPGGGAGGAATGDTAEQIAVQIGLVISTLPFALYGLFLIRRTRVPRDTAGGGPVPAPAPAPAR